MSWLRWLIGYDRFRILPQRPERLLSAFVGYNLPIWGIRKAPDGTVEFSCGGTGTGKDTVYVGFYYSPDGKPDAVCRGVRFADAANLRAGGQGFAVQNGQGGQYYTQHIVGNFYYYEANF